MDALNDKMVTAVDRTKLTILVTTDMPWQKKAEKSEKFRIWKKVTEGSTLVFEDTRISLKHNVGQAEADSVSIHSLICPPVLTKPSLCQADRHLAIAYTSLAQRHVGKNLLWPGLILSSSTVGLVRVEHWSRSLYVNSLMPVP